MEFKTLVYQFIYLATGCLSTMITVTNNIISLIYIEMF